METLTTFISDLTFWSKVFRKTDYNESYTTLVKWVCDQNIRLTSLKKTIILGLLQELVLETRSRRDWCNLTAKNTIYVRRSNLSWVYTSSLHLRYPHCVAIFYNLPWFWSIKVSNKKSQCNAENACGNQICKHALNNQIAT